jgi:hypothetical protein
MAKGLSSINRSGRFELIGDSMTVCETTSLEEASDMFELITAIRFSHRGFQTIRLQVC